VMGANATQTIPAVTSAVNDLTTGLGGLSNAFATVALGGNMSPAAGRAAAAALGGGFKFANIVPFMADLRIMPSPKDPNAPVSTPPGKKGGGGGGSPPGGSYNLPGDIRVSDGAVFMGYGPNGEEIWSGGGIGAFGGLSPVVADSLSNVDALDRNTDALKDVAAIVGKTFEQLRQELADGMGIPEAFDELARLMRSERGAITATVAGLKNSQNNAAVSVAGVGRNSQMWQG